jgi:hypothetical protein
MEKKQGSGQPVGLSLSDREMKRLTASDDMRRDPLTPFRDLVDYLDEAIRSARKTPRAREVTFDLQSLAAVLPRKTDFAVISRLLPRTGDARPSPDETRLSEDYDYRRCGNDFDPEFNDSDDNDTGFSDCKADS